MRESSSESDSRGGTPDDKKPRENEAGGEKRTKKTGSKEKGRKRTKTGCLTCRRRRIKCGEERPTCSNCTKSKRQCEGYSQRVVFKDPNTSYRGPPMSSSVPFVESEPFRQEGPPHQQSISTGPIPLAPKPSATFSINVITHDNRPPFSMPAVTTSGIEERPYGFVNATGNPLSAVVGPPSTLSYSFNGSSDTVDLSRIPEPSRTAYLPQDVSHYRVEAPQTTKEELKVIPPSPPASMDHGGWSATPIMSAPYYNTQLSSSNWPPESASSTSGTGMHSSGAASNSTPFPPWSNGEHQQATKPSDLYSEYARNSENSGYHVNQDWYSEEARVAPQPHGQPHEDEDDPFDVSEDDDTSMGAYDHDEDSDDDDLDTHLKNNDLGVVVALQARQDTVRTRSVTSFIDRPDMLSQYIPSSRSSPLRDPMTARVFCHFINVTGPVISMFERHPADPSLIFKGEPVPRSQQHIWTYTFPILALQSPGLLHAMCALASLHIARLQNKSITPSLKHYAYSLRRVAKSLSQPSRRGQPATLAAAMLLAFYEVWCADHQKWTNHLLGARMLVREIDFAGTTQYIKSMRRKQRQEEDYARGQKYEQVTVHGNGFEPSNVADDVNENIIAILMGKQLRYDQYGHVIDENIQEAGGNKVYTERDLEIYETQRDMFWWYCKQDVYQSILGGGKLFMEYDRWSHCPPRAPLGRLNATYGTFDHLVLLMGRLAEFAAKDLKRKQLATRINGGYQPPEGSPPGADHHGSQQQQQQYFPQVPQSPFQTQFQMPPFSGMVPVSDPKLPMGFGSTQQSPRSFHSDDVDLEALTIEAEEEWQDIRHAFSVLEDNFGDDFQQLGPEFSSAIDTPFGPALQYRTYAIAGIWMNFYMALIVCHRAHPSMPPAAMVAAGVAARHTSNFANEIGRIVAGIAPDCSSAQEVTPGVGAALVECGTAIFVGAVQYQNPAQRAWTVNRLGDMARLTGWETALAVRVGLESAWKKAAETGTGPPYVRGDHPEWVNGLGVFGTLKKEQEKGISSIDENFGKLDMGEDPREGPWLPRGIM